MRVARTLAALTAATILLSIAAAARAQTTNTEAQSSGTTTQSTDLQSRVRAGLKARLTGATEKIQAACGEDTKSFCGNVTRGEGKLLMCMMAHEDKISVKCDYALYAATRDIGVGVVTGDASDWIQAAALDAGCDVVLAKPCSRMLLLATIRRLLERTHHA